MGGFVNPFGPDSAWPDALAFAGSSWSGAGTGSGASSLTNSAAELEFLHLQNDSSSALLDDQAAEVTVASLALHEQLLLEQLQDAYGLNFEVDSALMAGTLDSVLSAPKLCSSNESSGINEDTVGLSQLPLGEQQEVPAAPDAWSSAFPQMYSLAAPQQGFSFGTLTNGDLLHETGTTDGKKYPQAPLQLHLHDDDKTGILSFAPGQQLDTNFDNLQIGQKEFSGLHHLNLSSLVSGQLSAFNATGAAVGPKQVQANQVRSATSIVRPEAPNGNVVAAGNGTLKPRRAKRGQATDPHSIAERLRREKISDRMKNLQELVPNSNKTDKASMLDEIIDYVKFLQLQVKVLSMSRLGATEAVVPLLTESQNENPGLVMPQKPRSTKTGGDVLEQSTAFEKEVVQLMENSMTAAMQYLQGKGLCLMPIVLASAFSDNKNGTTSMEVPPANGVTAHHGAGGSGTTGNVKKVPHVLKPMKSRA